MKLWQEVQIETESLHIGSQLYNKLNQTPEQIKMISIIWSTSSWTSVLLLSQLCLCLQSFAEKNWRHITRENTVTCDQKSTSNRTICTLHQNYLYTTPELSLLYTRTICTLHQNYLYTRTRLCSIHDFICFYRTQIFSKEYNHHKFSAVKRNTSGSILILWNFTWHHSVKNLV